MMYWQVYHHDVLMTAAYILNTQQTTSGTRISSPIKWHHLFATQKPLTDSMHIKHGNVLDF